MKHTARPWTPRGTCEACGNAWAGRDNRWCGNCGAPLRDIGPSLARVGREGILVRAGTLTLALIVVAGAAVAVTTEVRGHPGPGQALRDVAVDAPDADALGRIGQRVVPQPPPTRLPLCTGEPQCFAWVVQMDGWSRSVPDIVTGTLVLTQVAGGQVQAYRTEDGTMAWSQPLSSPGRNRWMKLAVVDDLLLHADQDGRLVGRGLGDGAVRWTTTEPLLEQLWDAGTIDGELLVVGERLAVVTGRRHAATIANIDATTGRVRWQADGRHATLGTDAAFLVDDERRLARLDGSGATTWRTEPLDDLQSVWPTTPVLAVSARERTRVVRTSDGVVMTGVAGQPLWPAGPVLAVSARERTRVVRTSDGAVITGVGGKPFVHDRDAAVVVDQTAADGVLLHLVSGDELLWTASPPATGCWMDALLTATTLDVRLCDRAIVSYDRADGTEVARTATADDEQWVWAGPYTLDDGDGSAKGHREPVVREAATGREIARLPAPMVPLSHHDGQRWTHEVDGIALLRSRNWLVAVRLPDQ